MITIADLRDHDAAIWAIMMGGIRNLANAMRFRRFVFTFALVALQAPLGWIACNDGNPGAGGSDGGVADGGEGVAAADVLVVGADVGTPACVADGGFTRPAAVPAFGSFSGPALSGDIGSGGAFAYLEHTSGSLSTPSQFISIIDPALSGDPAGFIHIATLANATGGELTVLAGVSAATPDIREHQGVRRRCTLCLSARPRVGRLGGRRSSDELSARVLTRTAGERTDVHA